MNKQNDIIARNGTERNGTERNEIIILGAIGNTDRQNRDNKRVLNKAGVVFALKSHIDKEPPMVIKKYVDKR